MKIHTKTVLADIDIPEHPKGIIHFIHGMMEEITDYEFLVKQITQNGFSHSSLMIHPEERRKKNEIIKRNL